MCAARAPECRDFLMRAIDFPHRKLHRVILEKFKKLFFENLVENSQSPVFCLTLYNVKLSRKIEGILNMLRKIVYEEKIFLLKKNESTEFFL